MLPGWSDVLKDGCMDFYYNKICRSRIKLIKRKCKWHVNNIWISSLTWTHMTCNSSWRQDVTTGKPDFIVSCSLLCAFFLHTVSYYFIVCFYLDTCRINNGPTPTQQRPLALGAAIRLHRVSKKCTETITLPCVKKAHGELLLCHVLFFGTQHSNGSHCAFFHTAKPGKKYLLHSKSFIAFSYNFEWIKTLYSNCTSQKYV